MGDIAGLDHLGGQELFVGDLFGLDPRQVRVRVMERVERKLGGHVEGEELVGAQVEHLDDDGGAVCAPEQGHCDACALPVSQLFAVCCRACHGGALLRWTPTYPVAVNFEEPAPTSHR